MRSRGSLIRCRTGSHRSIEVSHDQQERILGAPQKPFNHLGDGEKSDLVAAPDEEKNSFSLRVNGGPDRDTMSPIKSPAGLVQYRRPALSFLAMVGPPDAHATRRRSPCSGSHPPTRTGARLLLIGKCNLLRLDPPDKAIDRSLMRPVTVALSTRPYTCPSSHKGGYRNPAQRPE